MGQSHSQMMESNHYDYVAQSPVSEGIRKKNNQKMSRHSVCVPCPICVRVFLLLFSKVSTLSDFPHSSHPPIIDWISRNESNSDETVKCKMQNAYPSRTPSHTYSRTTAAPATPTIAANAPFSLTPCAADPANAALDVAAGAVVAAGAL